jgi:hypothetical protein
MRQFLHFTAAALLAACGSDPDPAPAATVVSSTPDSLDTASDDTDDVTIVVAYTDGDGDLGQGFAEITDCRSGVVTRLAIPPLASQEGIDEGVPISGELELHVADVGLVAPASTPPQICADLGIGAMTADQVVFCVILIDAGGLSGSGDCTAPITIQ